MAKWKCSVCDSEKPSCVFECSHDNDQFKPTQCAYRFNNDVVKWKRVNEQENQQKRLQIVEWRDNGILLNNGKEYSKIEGSCDVCCFKDKFYKSGNLKRSKCRELNMGYSVCGNYAWKRVKE